MKKGLLHIYCGEGKGKTTAAVGLAARAAGCNLKVLMVQFLKWQDSGELHSLAKLPQITLLRSGCDFGFSFAMTQTQKASCKADHNQLFLKAVSLCAEGEVDLLVLDELIPAYNLHLIDRTAVLSFLDGRPSSLEVVLTGRDPASELLALADYVSEIRKVKHPFDCGVAARKGIES